MFCNKKHLMQHHWTKEGGCGPGTVSPGSLKWLNIWTLYRRLQFFLKCQGKSLQAWLLRLCCLFLSTWDYIDHDSICTTTKILKLNNIYTYKESGYVDIVRLVAAYHDKEYLYCTLYFFNRNQIITVSQRMQPGARVIWQIMDDKEYDELMSRRLWKEVEKQNLGV